MSKYLKIEKDEYYFCRKRTNLNFVLVKIIDIFESGQIKIEYEDKQTDFATCEELYEFNPKNNLFKALMNITSYRLDSNIKQLVLLRGFKPEECMIKEEEKINTFDSDISREKFYKLYSQFFEEEKEYFFSVNEELKNVKIKGAENLDLYSLYKIVCENGGMEAITQEQKWKSLFYSSLSKTNVSYMVRTFYKKFLYEFEFKRRIMVNTETNLESQFKFNIGNKVYFFADNIKYFDTVKLRRNKGLNQYYVQLYDWSKEYNEWFSEDILFVFNGEFNSSHFNRRKTRSSKANNLVEDPLTREKHSHFTVKIPIQNEEANQNNLQYKNKNAHLDIFNVNQFNENRKFQIFEDSMLNYERKEKLNNYVFDKIIDNSIISKKPELKTDFNNKYQLNSPINENTNANMNYPPMAKKAKPNKKDITETEFKKEKDKEKAAKQLTESDEETEKLWQKIVKEIDEDEPIDQMTIWNHPFKRFFDK